MHHCSWSWTDMMANVPGATDRYVDVRRVEFLNNAFAQHRCSTCNETVLVSTGVDARRGTLRYKYSSHTCTDGKRKMARIYTRCDAGEDCPCLGDAETFEERGLQCRQRYLEKFEH